MKNRQDCTRNITCAKSILCMLGKKKKPVSIRIKKTFIGSIKNVRVPPMCAYINFISLSRPCGYVSPSFLLLDFSSQERLKILTTLCVFSSLFCTNNTAVYYRKTEGNKNCPQSDRLLPFSLWKVPRLTCVRSGPFLLRAPEGPAPRCYQILLCYWRVCCL